MNRDHRRPSVYLNVNVSGVSVVWALARADSLRASKALIRSLAAVENTHPLADVLLLWLAGKQTLLVSAHLQPHVKKGERWHWGVNIGSHPQARSKILFRQAALSHYLSPHCQLICWMVSLSHEHPAPDRYTTQQPPLPTCLRTHIANLFRHPPGLYITFNTLTVTVYNVSILQNHSANSRIAEHRLKKINNPLGQSQSISEKERGKERKVGSGAILALIDFSISCMNDYSMLAKWNGVINLSLGLFRRDLAPKVERVLERATQEVF